VSEVPQPDPYRLAALAVLSAANVPLFGYVADGGSGTPGLWFAADVSAAADQMRAELEAAEARGEARAVGRVAT
jgi:hypothetical protein